MGAGYIDSGIRAQSRRDELLLRAVRDRVGWRLTRRGTQGAVVLQGPDGVYLLAAGLSSLSLDDLKSKGPLKGSP